MNLCIDIGNTAVKAALDGCLCPVRGNDLGCIRPLASKGDVDKTIVCSTVDLTPEMRREIEQLGAPVVYMDHTTPIPLRNLYHTPETLGMDRLAAAVGAYEQHQGELLVIDAGTAITYDRVTADGEYLGGNISPGVEMRLKALHEFTAKLPLVAEWGNCPEFGYDTETAIRSGVKNGIKCEIEHIICEMFLKYPNIRVFFTGGDHFNFDNTIKNRIFADDLLVLKGLNAICGFAAVRS